MDYGYLVGSVAGLTAHEAAHAVTARMFGLRVKRAGMTWRGPYIVREPGDSVTNIIVSAAGPLANLVIAALTWRSSEWCAIANLVLGLSNLLPLEKTDGGRILREMKVLYGSPKMTPLEVPSLEISSD
jgi:Zn-dependent protease